MTVVLSLRILDILQSELIRILLCRWVVGTCDDFGPARAVFNRRLVMPHRILWLSTLEGFGIPLKVEKSKFHIPHQISAKTVPIDSLCFADETNTKNDVIRSIMKEIR